MFKIILLALAAARKSRRQLALENLALRHQLDVLQRNVKTPRLMPSDRAFWVLLYRFLPSWRLHLAIVRPETVVRWHRRGWRLFWRRKSRPRRAGRPRIETEIRSVIRRLSIENPLWGLSRIHGELLKPGYDVAEATVARHIVKPCSPPSQSWPTFLRNHLSEIVAIDFFTVPTATFRTHYVFLVLSVVRDRDSIYGDEIVEALRFLGIEQKIIAYQEARTHLALGKDTPEPRAIQYRDEGTVISSPVLGGLHHRYWREAA